MTTISVLNWLKAQTAYKFDDNTFIVIAYERGILDASVDFTTIEQMQRDLMYADLILQMVLQPAQNTHSMGHSGFTESWSTQSTYQKEKLKLALSIYKRYNDPKLGLFDDLDSAGIKQIPIKDKV